MFETSSRAQPYVKHRICTEVKWFAHHLTTITASAQDNSVSWYAITIFPESSSEDWNAGIETILGITLMETYLRGYNISIKY